MKRNIKHTNAAIDLVRDVTYRLPRERACVFVCDLIVCSPAHIDTDLLLEYAVHHTLFAEDLVEDLRGLHEATLQRVPWTHPTSGLSMVWIPTNTVYCPTVRDFTLGGFALSIHPITNRQWHIFQTHTGHVPKPSFEYSAPYLDHWKWIPKVSTPTSTSDSGTQGLLFSLPPERSFSTSLDHVPVTHISYEDAAAYCAWSGLTLPTQVMWSKAAFGIPPSAYPWGSKPPEKYMMHFDCEHPIRVGFFPNIRTKYGCQDMLGNVAELCLWVGSNAGEKPFEGEEFPSLFPTYASPRSEGTYEERFADLHHYLRSYVYGLNENMVDKDAWCIKQILSPRIRQTDLQTMPPKAIFCGGCGQNYGSFNAYNAQVQTSCPHDFRAPWLSARPAWVPESLTPRPYPNVHENRPSHPNAEENIWDDDDIPF